MRVDIPYRMFSLLERDEYDKRDSIDLNFHITGNYNLKFYRTRGWYLLCKNFIECLWGPSAFESESLNGGDLKYKYSVPHKKIFISMPEWVEEIGKVVREMK